MPADPVAAGRKGGQSKSPAKLAACKRNGFQKVKPAPDSPGSAPDLPIAEAQPEEGANVQPD